MQQFRSFKVSLFCENRSNVAYHHYVLVVLLVKSQRNVICLVCLNVVLKNTLNNLQFARWIKVLSNAFVS